MSYDLHVLRAAADGVQPALLLRAPGKKAEYLFNVPDGFSRLAMEHKLAPSARLSCVLLTCLLPASTGGLGGLLLRLKGDGHGQVQLIGPQGSSRITHALRHICRWRHPKVFVSESCKSGPIPVFEDEYIVIVPLSAGDKSTGCPWCLYAPSESPTSKILEKIPPATKSEMHNDSSSTDSSGSESPISSDDTSCTGFVQSTWDRVEGAYQKSLHTFNASSEMGNDFLPHNEFDGSSEFNSHESNGATVDSQEGHGLQKSGYILQKQRKRDAGHQPLLDFDEDFFGRIRLKKMKAEQDSRKVLGGLNPGPTPDLRLQGDDENTVLPKETASENSNSVPNSNGSRMMDAAEFLPASACRAELWKSSFVHSTKPYEWLVSNSQQDDLPRLEDDSNPVYGCHPSAQAQVISGVGTEKHRQLNETGDQNDLCAKNPARVLGYVSYLRKLNKGILFVDCRGLEDLESLRTHPTLSCLHHTSGSPEDDEANMFSKTHAISATVHLTPHGLVQSSDYQSWMSSVRSPFHVVMNDKSPEFGFQSSLAMLQRLNNIHQEIFPHPFNMVTNSKNTQLTRESMKNRNGTIVDASLCMCLTFCEDGTTLSRTSVDPLSLEKISSLANNSEQVSKALLTKVEVPSSDGSARSHLSPDGLAAMETQAMLPQQKKTILSKPSSGLSHREDDLFEDIDIAFNVDSEVATQVVLNDNQPTSLTPEKGYAKFQDHASEFQLVFLGTGCAAPSKHRGSSSILLQVRGAQGAMLLDAGEGASGQLFRRFGEKAARTIISSLQCVWLSHKHGDHVLGVLSILQSRSSQAPPLVIVGPHKVGEWLSEVQDTCSARDYPIPQFVYIHCDELSHSEKYRNEQQHAKQILGVLDAMLLKSMLSVKVFHCPDAYGIVLFGRRGWKVVYSGDTRPCERLIEAGQGCTLLIHEATFEDSLVGQAKFTRHSTVSEAVMVGRQMHAQHIILTHFSQRYPEMVTVSDDKKETLSLAFDGMVVPSQLLDSLGKLLPRIRMSLTMRDMVVPSQLRGSLGALLPQCGMSFQKTVSIPPITETGEQRSEGTLKPMPIRDSESAVLQNSARESLVAKHTRWSSDSDDEAPDQCPDGDAISTSVNWSSDSDEGAEFSGHGGLFMRNGSREPPAGGFSVTNSCKGGCGTGLDSFRGMLGSSLTDIPSVGICAQLSQFKSCLESQAQQAKVQREIIEQNCDVYRSTADTKETAGPLGGKHLRWIDSDSEDG